jgi:PKD repeat protein
LSPSWSIGGASIASLTASHVYDAPGTYAATLTVTDKDGGSGAQEVAVDVQKRGATLSYVGDASAPFGFGSVGARFGDPVDAATARVDGRAVTFAGGDTTFTASTAGGLATAAVGPALLPGAYAVEARFDGDELYLPADAAGSLTVTNSVGKTTGDVALGDGTRVAFVVAGDGTAVTGSLTAGSFTASRLAALGISGRAAWFAGTGDDGRAFVAYVEDNGEPGRGVDVFRLWLAGEAHAGSGVIGAGNVQLHR